MIDSVKSVKGQFQHGETSKVEVAYLSMEPEIDHVSVTDPSGRPLLSVSYTSCSSSDRIPGLPVPLVFDNGARFTPDDVNCVWPNASKTSSIIYALEKRWKYVLSALVLFVAIAYTSMTYGVPYVSFHLARVLPDSVGDQLGRQTLSGLDRLVFRESELPEDLQRQVSTHWQTLLRQLDLPLDQYNLVFRQWEFGPNAFALADGTVVVTDGIVHLMAQDLAMLDAVMLHEIGHVEHRHVLQNVVHGSLMTALYSFLFSDIEGLGEVVLGAGIGVLNSAYSRDMEREADAYAHLQLEALGRLPTDLSRGLALLEQHHHEVTGGDRNEDGWLNGYFDSHPNTAERIRAAEGE